MSTLSIQHVNDPNDKRVATLKVAGYAGIALLLALMLALMLGLLLSGGDWTLPMEPAVAANFTA